MNHRNKQKAAAIFALFCLVFIVSTTHVYAEDYPPMPSPTITPSDYKLPYPGLLPDNPLYFLKSFRDNMMEFFISKPLARADFMLLQSDKQVAASGMLIDQEKGKTDLAVTTFHHGQDDFAEAINQAQLARKQGMNVDEIAKKLLDANQKHFQVLDQIEQQIKDKSKFQEIRKRENSFTGQLKPLQKKV